jgi:hypothetical protein
MADQRFRSVLVIDGVFVAMIGVLSIAVRPPAGPLKRGGQQNLSYQVGIRSRQKSGTLYGQRNSIPGVK